MLHQQVIGDRTVINPRVRTQNLGSGRRPCPVTLSMETCGCGHSYARTGVGYRTHSGWVCKRCNQMHTTHPGMEAPPEQLRPDPEAILAFDARAAFAIPYAYLSAEDIRTARPLDLAEATLT